MHYRRRRRSRVGGHRLAVKLPPRAHAHPEQHPAQMRSRCRMGRRGVLSRRATTVVAQQYAEQTRHVGCPPFAASIHRFATRSTAAVPSTGRRPGRSGLGCAVFCFFFCGVASAFPRFLSLCSRFLFLLSFLFFAAVLLMQTVSAMAHPL